jgi:hypothetical protein
LLHDDQARRKKKKKKKKKKEKKKKHFHLNLWRQPVIFCFRINARYTIPRDFGVWAHMTVSNIKWENEMENTK